MMIVCDGTHTRPRAKRLLLGDALTHPYLAGHNYAGVRVDIRGTGESAGLPSTNMPNKGSDPSWNWPVAADACLEGSHAHTPPGVT